jgi:hypothetical protein
VTFAKFGQGIAALLALSAAAQIEKGSPEEVSVVVCQWGFQQRLRVMSEQERVGSRQAPRTSLGCEGVRIYMYT